MRKITWPNIVTREILAICALYGVSLVYAVAQGFPGVIIAQLQTSDSDLNPITSFQAATIAGSGIFSSFFGALSSGFVMDKYGRKVAIVVFYLVILNGCLIQFAATNTLWIYVARLVTGFGIGLSGVISTLVAELTRAENRSFALSVSTGIAALGYVLLNSLAYWYYWRTLTALFSIIIFMALLAHCLLVPESPAWLVSAKRDIDGARSVLNKLRSNPSAVEKELSDLEDVCAQNSLRDAHFGNQLKLWKEKAVWKPFLIVLAYSVYNETSGVAVISRYPITFFDALKCSISGKVGAVCSSGIRFAMCLVTPFLVMKCKRRKLAIYSAFGMFVATVSTTLWQLYTPVESWIPIIFVTGIVLFNSLGTSYIPYMLTAELFTLRTRGYQSAYINAANNLLALIMGKSFYLLLPILDIWVMMAFFSLTTGLGAIFVLIYLPETNRKSLTEIEREQKSLKKNKKGEPNNNGS